MLNYYVFLLLLNILSLCLVLLGFAQPIQSPRTLHKAPETLYKDPTDITKFRKDYTKPRNSIQRPKILDKTFKD